MGPWISDPNMSLLVNCQGLVVCVLIHGQKSRCPDQWDKCPDYQGMHISEGIFQYIHTALLLLSNLVHLCKETVIYILLTITLVILYFHIYSSPNKTLH